MADKHSIAEMESVLDQRGVSVAEFCRKANIQQTTWWRWKVGRFYPSHRAWQAVSEAYREITAADGAIHD